MQGSFVPFIWILSPRKYAGREATGHTQGDTMFPFPEWKITSPTFEIYSNVPVVVSLTRTASPSRKALRSWRCHYLLFQN